MLESWQHKAEELERVFYRFIVGWQKRRIYREERREK